MEKAQISKRALVTLATGDFYIRMGEITIPLMRSYAKRCGVDFVVIDTPRVQVQYGLPPRYDKFQVYELLKEYDQIAFLDNDILVVPDAPSIFDLVDLGVFAASSEETFSKAPTDKAQELLGSVNWKHPYFNSGVMVFGKAHSAVFEPTEMTLHLWASGKFKDIHGVDGADQAYLNHRVNLLDIPFLDLGYKFNHTRVIIETHKRFLSYFIHYSGVSGHRYGERLIQMGKDAEVMLSPWRLRLSRKYPRLRWVFDRCDRAFIEYLYRQYFCKY